MAAPEANQIGSRIVLMDEESNIIVFDRETNIIKIKRKLLVIYCPKCCIPVTTVVNKKVNVSGCGNTICTFFAMLCLNLVLGASTSVLTCGILAITYKSKWYKEADGFWKYMHVCPTCGYEIATYKPRVGCMERCGLTLLALMILGLIFVLVIWATIGKYW